LVNLSESVFTFSPGTISGVLAIRLVETASIPIDIDLPKAQQLSDLLLNPRADRSVIWFCIVANQPLIDFLTQYQSITIQAICPKPRTRVHGDDLDFREFQFTGFKWKVPTTLSYWPVIAGVLNDLNDVPWFQSSPKEFAPTSPKIWTANKHTRTPEFAMLPTDSQEEDHVFIQNTITLPRGKRGGHWAKRSDPSRSISANANP